MYRQICIFMLITKKNVFIVSGEILEDFELEAKNQQETINIVIIGINQVYFLYYSTTNV